MSASAVVVVGAASCGGRSATPDALDRELERLSRGATVVERAEANVTRGERELGFRVGLEPPRCYRVVPVADPEVRALSVDVSDPTGARLDRLTAGDDRTELVVCPKIPGPHRVGATAEGHGVFKVAVFAVPEREPPSASASASAPACGDVGADLEHQRLVLGADRVCEGDADCITVKLDCSHLRCTGIHQGRSSAYARPIDCRGYTGAMGNYDCDPQFKIEVPACVGGCCVSRRVE